MKSKSTEEILRSYVRSAINEDLYFKGIPKYIEQKRKRSFFDKVTSFLTGRGAPDEIFEEWSEDQELYGVDLNEYPELRDKIKQFVRDNYDKAEARARGDKNKLERILRRGIDNKFQKQLHMLKARSENLDDT